MAFQRIRIKNTNVSGKIPGADKLDVAELCINLKDQKLYSKDADGNVFELGGKIDSGINPPGTGNEIGDLFWDGDVLLIWDGNEWVPVGATDLDYTAAPDKGTITNSSGDDAELPLVDDTNAGLMSPGEHKKLNDMPVIISGDTFPGTPSAGDIWIDTNLCPPSINIWNDCEDPGNPGWTPIGGGDPTGCQQGGVSIVGDNEIGSTLTATGGRGLDAGELLPDPIYTWTGPNGFTATGASIVAAEEGDYTVTATITCIDGSELDTSATRTISDSYVDMVNNTPPVIAVVGELPDGAYAGNNLYVVTPATVINGDSPVIVENQWFRDGVEVITSQLYAITASDPEGSVITCKQLFRDARTNELLSEASNGIAIVARPADAITFTPVITDDGTANANKVGSVLTANATNIVGGTSPIEYGFEWKSAGATVGAVKTYTLQSSDVGKIIQCDVTVAEPDGTNPETRTATYTETIEVLGTINKPTVLAPADGAGSGASRPIVTDTIIDVDNTAGSYTCETDLIESVDATYLADIQKGGFKQVGGSTVGGGLGGVTEYTIDFKTETPSGADNPAVISARAGSSDATSTRLAFDENYGLNIAFTTLGEIFNISDPGLVAQGEIATIRIVRNATVTRVYKNGILHKEITHNGEGIWQSFTSPLCIGAQFLVKSVGAFNGPLGFVKVWTSAAPNGTTEPTTGLILDAPLTGDTQALDRVTGNQMSFEGDADRSVDYNYALPERKLTLSGTKDLDCFAVGDVVQAGGTEPILYFNDKFASFVNLALPFNGNNTDYSTTINPSETRASNYLPEAAGGKAPEYTSFSKHYDKSLQFFGTGFLKEESQGKFNYGTGDFTAEAWIWLDKSNTAEYIGIWSVSEGSNLVPKLWFDLRKVSGTYRVEVHTNGLSNSLMPLSSDTAVPMEEWVHVAVVRESSQGSFYINGVKDTNTFSFTTDILFADTVLSYVGWNGETKADSAGKIVGFIQDLRLYKGLAKEFSPEIVTIVSIPDPQTEPLPTIVVDGGEWAVAGDAPADQNQDKIWSTGGQPANLTNPWTKAFDGSLVGAWLAVQGASITWVSPAKLNGTVEVWIPNGKGGIQSFSLNGGIALNGTDNSWLEIGTVTNEIATITSTGNDIAGAELFAVKVDGKILVDAAGDTTVKGKTTSWDTTLTLDGATDLDVLQPGDTVKMGDAADVPYQPISDSIVNVRPPALLAFSYSANTWTLTLDRDYNNEEALLIITQGADTTQSNFGSTWSGAFPGDVTAELTGTSGGKIEVYDLGPSTAQYTSGSLGSTLYVQWVNITGTQSFVKARITGSTGSTFTTGLYGGSAQYVPGSVEIKTSTILTLSGDTDLAYFRRGDVVQGYNVASGYSTGRPNTILTPRTWESYWNGTIVDAVYAETGSGIYSWTFDYALSGVFVIKRLSGQDAPSARWFITDDSGTRPYGLADFDPVDQTLTVSVFNMTAVGIESIANNDAAGIAFMSLDGRDLKNSAVKIISIDDSVPSITVDGGNWSGSDGSGTGWNQDEEWSETTVGTAFRPVSNAFSGYISTVAGSDIPNYIESWTSSLDGARNQVNFDVTVNTSVTLYGYRGGQSLTTGSKIILIKSDGTDLDISSNLHSSAITPTSKDDMTYAISSAELTALGGTLKGIASISPNSNDACFIFGIEVDGKLLVDEGIAGAPDTKVTCLSPLKAPTNWKVEVIDTDNNQLSLSHATPNDNAQVWVANDNQAGTDFNVIADRTIVDDPLLTADVRLQSSLFATTPADADTLKNIVWELNGAEQNAGTSNPYSPTLSTDTTYTVRVKHQGNALEDSPWSDSTTFTTGATRNLYTYYKERVEVLENRLAGLEADEVVDDATDITLLTVVADLIQRVETLENP